MVIIITGTTHTGKTKLAQQALEKYKYPYLSIDHLKMGLIRSNNTSLTVNDDEKLTSYLWPIVKEIIKTAIENNQNLIVEGCYVPFNYKDDFSNEYLAHIEYYCLIMSEQYINNNFNEIKNHANDIEQRIDDFLDKNELIKENNFNLNMCKKYNNKYIFIDSDYNLSI
jgi:2-phosphoglycerate kinase